MPGSSDDHRHRRVGKSLKRTLHEERAAREEDRLAKKVFVSLSGEIGRKLAEELRDTILDDAELAPWVSSLSLEAGKPWFEEIERAAAEADIAIGCLTPGSGRRPWVN